jgi:hypothetical protein
VENEPAQVDDIRRLRDLAAVELENAQRDLSGAQRRLEDARERLRLLDRLLAVELPAESGTEATLSTADALLDACEAIIAEAGKPLHIRDLLNALIKRGIPLPGRGLEANLIVRLQRSNGRFVRVGRGTYAPANLGLPEKPPTRQRRVATRP